MSKRCFSMLYGNRMAHLQYQIQYESQVVSRVPHGCQIHKATRFLDEFPHSKKRINGMLHSLIVLKVPCLNEAILGRES